MTTQLHVGLHILRTITKPVNYKHTLFLIAIKLISRDNLLEKRRDGDNYQPSQDKAALVSN